MIFRVQVGAPHIAIHQAQTVLVTQPDGQLHWPSDRGLYFRDTRVISAWAFMLLQAMLGIQQDGAARQAICRPCIAQLDAGRDIARFALGRQRFDIRFWRDRDDTAFEVLKGKRDAVVRRTMTLTRRRVGRRRDHA